MQWPEGPDFRRSRGRRCGSSRAAAPQAKGSANENRLVMPREIELMHGLGVEFCGEPLFVELSVAPIQHVGRGITSVRIESAPSEGDQEAPGSTARVEDGLSRSRNRLLEISQVLVVVVELGPPAGDQSVVPDSAGYSRCLR